MIYYNDFRIRRISIDDAKFMTELRSDPSTNSMLGHFIFVNEEGQQSPARPHSITVG